MQNIIEYTNERTIRVLPEFDTPGHTLSWGKSQPELLSQCFNGNQTTDTFGPVGPSKNSSYKFLEQLLREVSHRFFNKYLHLGGDDVHSRCWTTNPQILAFMDITNQFNKLEEYYIKRVIDIAKSLNKIPIVWQEVFDNGFNVDPDTIVE
ncbi:beta-hexosaminidase subunit beta-like [Oppia nitens]|uniref:beta-hexosaminidase subunit beta-like n=1 Tax=Oppia nitens TaxID=1686743 RepID=UPI0023DC5D64|nr:beta-hexosaminidase subunit beta-like [Oppia nitens]